ncbi:MAG: alpha/beta hydrolase [Bacteroidota bacterium]
MQYLAKTILPTFLFIVIVASFSSCRIAAAISDKQIDRHFKNHTAKPVRKYISYKQYHIHNVSLGDATKPLLLLVHGAPGAWYSYLAMMDDPEMQANYHMVAVDRIGFDKSNSGIAVTSIDEHVNYLKKIVDEYNTAGQKIYILGASYGAPIAAAFAMKNPDLVKELFLLSPVIDPSKEKIFWFTYMCKLSFINMWLEQSLNVATEEKFDHRSELKKLKPNWKNITCKTYVVMGKKDWIADPLNFEFAQKMLTNADGAEFYLIENSGHAVMQTRPDLIKKLLLHQKVE